MIADAGLKRYIISCSRLENTGLLKKSFMEISSPSQIFLRVDTVTLLFLPLTILFKVD